MSEGPREGIRQVTTATEFLAAVEAGYAVDFEIEPGGFIRSNVNPHGPNWLVKKLANMVDAERVSKETGVFRAPEGHEPDAA